jgi:cysteine protease ATG4
VSALLGIVFVLTALLEYQLTFVHSGRPSSSHYFIGTQADHLFYLDPHTTRPLLPASPSEADIATCHTRRLRLISLDDMDPSMLLGFLIRDEAEWHHWKATMQATPPTRIVNVYKEETSLSGDFPDIESCSDGEGD